MRIKRPFLTFDDIEFSCLQESEINLHIIDIERMGLLTSEYRSLSMGEAERLRDWLTEILEAKNA